MSELIGEYGFLALFLLSFFAATILPFSSESAVVAALLLNLEASKVFIFASTGNSLAVFLNMILGLWLKERVLENMSKKPRLRDAYNIWQKYHHGAILLSWLPVIGDPITLFAGMIKKHFIFILMIIILLRVARYALIISLF